MADDGQLLFKDKQARLILALADESKEWYLSSLAKSADVTYVHTSKFIGRCEELGIISSEMHGKIKRVYLTEKGKSIATGILDIMNKIKKEQPLPEKK